MTSQQIRRLGNTARASNRKGVSNRVVAEIASGVLQDSGWLKCRRERQISRNGSYGMRNSHIFRTASTDQVLSRLAWTYQQSRRCRNLAGISGKQSGLSLRKASMKVSITYHRGVKTTNASSNLSSPRPRNIFQE